MINKIMIALPALVVLVCASESFVNARNRFTLNSSERTDVGHQPRVDEAQKRAVNYDFNELLRLEHVQPIELPDNQYTYTF
ncbi:hypothetical protein AKN87_07390 [Thiopseudomonas alkaliphila]|uniref:hypothetical protein n=1 Tax=Thiopseudomonas alkaliphila TaxID=1697053 RepID=UPI00069DB6EE|nr:hypothetical protein [Thiopseudomonas alkaliphila]AKX44934.1 hypothetical protein AKN87_07390 [Thiopseudomonas alkaliphila]